MRLGSKSIKGSFDVCRSGRFLFYTKNKMVFVKMRKWQIPTKEKTWCHHFLLFVNVSNPMHKGANTNRLSQNRSAGDRFQSKGGPFSDVWSFVQFDHLLFGGGLSCVLFGCYLFQLGSHTKLHQTTQLSRSKSNVSVVSDV